MKYKAIVIVVFSFVTSLLLLVPNVRASEVEIQAKEDSSVKSANPDTNYGNDNFISAGDNFGDILVSYIQFDISNLVHQDIESISLRLKVSYHTGVMGSNQLSFVESNWVEGSITYNTQPSIIEFIRQSIDPFLSVGDFKSFSLKINYINTGNLISFKLERSSGMIIFHSKEVGGTNAPTLVIIYAEPLITMEGIYVVLPFILVGVSIGTIWSLLIVEPYIRYKLKRKSS
ncbi:hypothetical protein LCGC14_1437730 [marine sediment metagenome]|uniref:Carbohydrate-binding module family 96 domain-containing protein n=1 Tax=marine sediment metagenome TaxID=412755 RepID=A0A0F9MNF0_9ZZZZ